MRRIGGESVLEKVEITNLGIVGHNLKLMKAR